MIPEKAVLEGTIRTMTVQSRELVKRRLEEVAKNTAALFGATVELIWVFGLPPMQNDKDLTDFAREFAQKCGFKTALPPSSLGGEDFALYEEHIKGAFVQIGSGPSLPNHNPGFTADEKALYPAARFMADLAVHYLENYGK